MKNKEISNLKMIFDQNDESFLGSVCVPKFRIVRNVNPRKCDAVQETTNSLNKEYVVRP